MTSIGWSVQVTNGRSWPRNINLNKSTCQFCEFLSFLGWWISVTLLKLIGDLQRSGKGQELNHLMHPKPPKTHMEIMEPEKGTLWIRRIKYLYKKNTNYWVPCFGGCFFHDLRGDFASNSCPWHPGWVDLGRSYRMTTQDFPVSWRNCWMSCIVLIRHFRTSMPAESCNHYV